MSQNSQDIYTYLINNSPLGDDEDIDAFQRQLESSSKVQELKQNFSFLIPFLSANERALPIFEDILNNPEGELLDILKSKDTVKIRNYLKEYYKNSNNKELPKSLLSTTKSTGKLESLSLNFYSLESEPDQINKHFLMDLKSVGVNTDDINIDYNFKKTLYNSKEELYETPVQLTSDYSLNNIHAKLQNELGYPVKVDNPNSLEI